MGRMPRQNPVKLVVSIIFRDKEHLEYAEKRLTRLYGDVEPLVWSGPFSFTGYYCQEFGEPLFRKILCFKRLVDISSAGRTKIQTNVLEDRTRVGGKRKVNIDPGYVTEAKLVLLTTKDYSHRIHLDKGIFAETTLHYQRGKFRPWPWTYPDYASPELVSYFSAVREIYRRDLAERGYDAAK